MQRPGLGDLSGRGAGQGCMQGTLAGRWNKQQPCGELSTGYAPGFNPGVSPIAWSALSHCLPCDAQPTPVRRDRRGSYVRTAPAIPLLRASTSGRAACMSGSARRSSSRDGSQLSDAGRAIRLHTGASRTTPAALAGRGIRWAPLTTKRGNSGSRLGLLSVSTRAIKSVDKSVDKLRRSGARRVN